jgi:glutaredoxin
MPRLNRQDIDRKTNKPNPRRTEGLSDDLLLNRALQTRRDDDVIRTAQRTTYDIDYAIKWYIDNEIQPQVEANKQLISVPVIFANGEKWDNVRRLGYLRDEKGMLQSPIIMLKRNSVIERDSQRTLDANRPHSENQIVYRGKYNARNRYEDELFPIPTNKPVDSEKLYVVDIPKYVTIEYDLMLWCDFTTQMNALVDQILPYGRFAWGNESNKFPTALGQFSFETVNTVGEDRLVRASTTLTVQGTLLSAQESRISTIKKMYSIKKVTFDQYVDVSIDLFSTTIVPQQIVQMASSGITVNVTGATTATLTAQAMAYLTTLTDQQATHSNATTVTVNAYAAINPVTFLVATKNEFDVYINGQYIDKQLYTWTPSDVATQTIVFDTAMLGYPIESTDTVIINGRWS